MEDSTKDAEKQAKRSAEEAGLNDEAEDKTDEVYSCFDWVVHEIKLLHM